MTAEDSIHPRRVWAVQGCSSAKMASPVSEADLVEKFRFMIVRVQVVGARKPGKVRGTGAMH